LFKVWTKHGFIRFSQPPSVEFNYTEYSEKPHYFVNAYSLTLANSFADYHAVLTTGVVYCDSRIISLYSRLVGSPVTQLRGADFMREGLFQLRGIQQVVISGLTYSSEELSMILSREIIEGIEVSNFLPPFTSEVPELVKSSMDFLRYAEPRIVWVAVGTPKQDILASKLSREYRANYFCIGAALNFLTKTISECPTWLSFIGLEWLFRLMQEPRRLWKRYLIGNLRFLGIIWSDLLYRIMGSEERRGSNPKREM
jgi:N-acetylglucosaminyldiphosphoundecaprenol N-acetyl-beta-D-mannosaminyltransferase